MPDLTLQERFGKQALLDLEYNQLIISLDDLKDFDPNTQLGDFTNGQGLDISKMTEANKHEYVSAIFWALIFLNKQNQSDNNNDETVSLYVTNQGRRNSTRNGVAQIGFQELVTAYIDDPTALTLDPDSLAAQSNSGQA